VKVAVRALKFSTDSFLTSFQLLTRASIRPTRAHAEAASVHRKRTLAQYDVCSCEKGSKMLYIMDDAVEVGQAEDNAGQPVPPCVLLLPQVSQSIPRVHRYVAPSMSRGNLVPQLPHVRHTCAPGTCMSAHWVSAGIMAKQAV
jgi:hypothetical protein